MTTELETAGRVVIGREAIRGFYDDYYDILDSMNFEEWPELFSEECSYRVVSRENHEAGLPLALVGAESRGMLHDRVTGLRKTQVFAPRYYRRFPGPLRFMPATLNGTRIEHNLLVVQTLTDKQSEIVLVAHCSDLLVRENGRVLLKRRHVVYDSEMIPNSLIYPV